VNVVQLIYLLGSPPALVMPFYYHFTNKWWTTKEGRLFMLMMLLPFGLYASTVLFILVDHSLARDVVRYILVGLASLGSWSTLVVYYLIRREELCMRPLRRKRK
jgi:hypothetical protein